MVQEMTRERATQDAAQEDIDRQSTALEQREEALSVRTVRLNNVKQRMLGSVQVVQHLHRDLLQQPGMEEEREREKKKEKDRNADPKEGGHGVESKTEEDTDVIFEQHEALLRTITLHLDTKARQYIQNADTLANKENMLEATQTVVQEQQALLSRVTTDMEKRKEELLQQEQALAGREQAVDINLKECHLLTERLERRERNVQVPH
jgi:hypothetical protein